MASSAESVDPACAISLASGKQQPMTAQIRNCQSTKFPPDLNTESENLTEVNKIVALIGHRACAAWKNIVHAALAHSSTVPLNWRKLTPIMSLCMLCTTVNTLGHLLLRTPVLDLPQRLGASQRHVIHTNRYITFTRLAGDYEIEAAIVSDTK